jgi:hypothetical protein
VTNIPDPTQAELQALDASILRLLVWLVGVIARLGAPRRSKLLHRIVRLCERNTEAVVFDMAAARWAPPAFFRRAGRRKASAPPGFRVKRIKGYGFFNHARVRLGAEAGFAARVLRLIDVLADPEPCLARALKVIAVGRTRTRLVAAAPPADPMRTPAFAATAFADSS